MYTMYTDIFDYICSPQHTSPSTDPSIFTNMLYISLLQNIPSTKAKECQESLKIIWAVSFRCGQPATVHAPVGVPVIMVAWERLGDSLLHNSESKMNLFFL